MKNKVGAIVAIEPNSGEILALISSPSYNPNLLIGRNRSINYKYLVNDFNKPLFSIEQFKQNTLLDQFLN